jgi:hypothetical protein
MGDDGVVMKRLLLGDPYNPVSLVDILWLSWWKIVLFYLFLITVVINLLETQRGKRILCLLALNRQDDLFRLNQYFPFHPTFQQHGEFVYSLGKGNWRKTFADRALFVWSQGGDIWVSKCLLQVRPKPEWLWVEGEVRQPTWVEIYGYFSQLEKGRSVGGDDGFVLVLPSTQNEQILRTLQKHSFFSSMTNS